MKVVLQVELEVEPEQELTNKQQQNVTGMMRRLVEHRLLGLMDQRYGGEKSPVGWEVHLNRLNVEPVSKVK